MPRVVGIVQARMGSRRLPGKSMADLAGRPLLERVLERALRAARIDDLILATTVNREDDVLDVLARDTGVQVFRGSQDDLIDRYWQTAQLARADVIVRICADNPVLEGEEIDRIVEHHLQGTADFSSNTHNILDNQYPDGLGAEVYTRALFDELRRTTTDAAHREHPHSFVYEHPERFRIETVMCPPAFRRPDLKLDVNTAGELAYIQALYDYCYTRNPRFHITDVIAWHDDVYVHGARLLQ